MKDTCKINMYWNKVLWHKHTKICATDNLYVIQICLQELSSGNFLIEYIDLHNLI